MQKLRTRTEQTDGKMESCPAAVAGCWLIRACVRRDAGRYHARRVTVSHCVTCHTCHTPLSHSHSSHRYLDVPTHQDQVSLSRHTTTSRFSPQLHALVSLHVARGRSASWINGLVSTVSSIGRRVPSRAAND